MQSIQRDETLVYRRNRATCDALCCNAKNSCVSIVSLNRADKLHLFFVHLRGLLSGPFFLTIHTETRRLANNEVLTHFVDLPTTLFGRIQALFLTEVMWWCLFTMILLLHVSKRIWLRMWNAGGNGANVYIHLDDGKSFFALSHNCWTLPWTYKNIVKIWYKQDNLFLLILRMLRWKHRLLCVNISKKLLT